MKNLFLSMVLFMSTFSYSQVGVITINEDDLMPTDQWFVFRGEDNEDVVYYYNNLESCKGVINKLLEVYSLDFTDASIDEDGVLFWGLDHINGYASSIRFYPDKEDGQIIIYTYRYIIYISSNN